MGCGAWRLRVRRRVSGRLLALVGVVVLTAGPTVLLDVSSAGAATIPYTFTGGPETLTVPAGVCGYQVVAFGANGGQVSGVGGIGGGAEATILVAAGDVLQINVGGAGQPGANPDPVGPGGAGGFNGGGPGGDSSRAVGSAGGGGASDVRTGTFSLGERVVVAGGGGGGANGGAAGGDGGGTAGAPGVSPPRGGGGGTQVLGGAGGTSPNDNGVAGVSGVGGDGGDQSAGDITLTGGGGGGGGYFGGGGGGAAETNEDENAGGGGGGSGFGTTLTQGSNPNVDFEGDGSVTLTEIPCFAGVGTATGGFPTNYPKSNTGAAAVAATPILVVPRFTG